MIEDATEKVGSRCDRWDREQSDLTRKETGLYTALIQGKVTENQFRRNVSQHFQYRSNWEVRNILLNAIFLSKKRLRISAEKDTENRTA